jgi:hypothetical protein
MPNELERQQIFYLLKRDSSHTTWKRLLGYYKAWADIAEASVREADNRGLETSLGYSSYARIVKDLAYFDEGVARLGKGDKRVFTNGVYGLFVKGNKLISYYTQYMWKIEDGEMEWKETTPYTKEFFEAVNKFSRATNECWRRIIQSDHPKDVAPVCYSLWDIVFLPRLPYPATLPKVPEPEEDVIVKTGSWAPCSGIWEPVSPSSWSSGLFRSKPRGPFQRIGALNYLHGGEVAPSIDQVFRDSSDHKYGCRYITTEVIWRLIWRDDRYKDGTIPDEEKDYLYVEPMSDDDGPYRIEPTNFLKKHGLKNPLLQDMRSAPSDRVEGGQPCPREGYWWSPANKSQGRIFKKGEIMPNVSSSTYGQTYWLWGGEESKK